MNISAKISSKSYYPFGMVIPGRSFSTTAYKWGFNGQEKDDEVYGSGNLNTAMFWEYDTRLGRRWNIDPMPRIWESSYSVFGGNPISRTDRLGNRWKDPESKKVGDRLIGKLNTKISVAQSQYNKNLEKAQGIADKGDSEKFNKALDKLEESGIELRSLMSSRNELQIMGDEKTEQVFGFQKLTGNTGYTQENVGKDGKSEIIMKYNSDPNAIHEATHGFQLHSNREQRVGIENGVRLVATDAAQEIEAYQRQFFFTTGEYNDYGETINFNVGNNIRVVTSKDINIQWLRTIVDESGKQLYPIRDYPSDMRVPRPLHIVPQR